MSTINNTLWVEKYRPKTLDGYVGNADIVSKMQSFIDNDDIPHLLFYAKPGTGKTTLAKILVNTISCDHLYINASDENNVDTIRNKIKTFASSVGFKKWKVIILDEADHMTSQAQAALRNVMETFSKHSRFILTCNYVEKVIPAIQSRCVTFNVLPPSMKDVAKRATVILEEENMTYDIKDVAKIVKQEYPDIRSVIKLLQSSCHTGTLQLSESIKRETNYLTNILDTLKGSQQHKDKFVTCRQILANSGSRTFEPLYSFLFDEVQNFAGNNLAGITITIAKYAYQDNFVVDKELNAMALLTEIISEL